MMDKLLQNNLVMRISSLVLAIMLWMIVSMDDQPQLNVTPDDGRLIDNVRVEAIYDDEFFNVVEMEDTVQVLLSGRRALLNASMLRGESYRVYADLTDLGEGEHTVVLEHEGFPTDLDVEIMPAAIRVTLEARESEVFPVEMEWIGQLQQGYSISEMTVTPAEAFVFGSIDLLEQVETVKGFFDITAGEQIARIVDLVAYDSIGNELDVEISPSAAEVEVLVVPPSKVVPVRYYISESLPEGLSLARITPDVNEVEVFAEQDVLDELEEVRMDLDLSELRGNDSIVLDLPGNEDWFGMDPEEVIVDVEVEASQERRFSDLEIEVRGNEQLEIAFPEHEGGLINVLIYGSRDRLANLESEDIQLFIDVEGLDAGNHTVPLRMRYSGQRSYFQSNQENMDIPIRLMEVENNDD